MAGDPFAQCPPMQDLYADDAVWHAPGRGLVWRGREEVLGGLAREAVLMKADRMVRSSCVQQGSLLLKEFVKEFDYLGGQVDRLVLPVGSRIQLQRLRILTVVDSLVMAETCLESWRVLARLPPVDLLKR